MSGRQPSHEFQARNPAASSFRPTPNSLLASEQYAGYTNPYQSGHPSRTAGGGGRQSSYGQYGGYRDEPDPSSSYGHGHGYGYGAADARSDRPLYYEPGEERDQAFDVRADFDGDGPRWSEMYGTGKGDPRNYHALDDDRSVKPAPVSAPKSATAAAEREELVSVPVLGPEWQKSELHELSRRGKAELKAEKRDRAWKQFARDERGVCGIRWLTRKGIIIILFCLIVAAALILFFTIPRPPSFSFYQPQPFTADNSTVAFARVPANFSWTGNLNLYADTSNSYLPLQFSDIEATLYHLTTNKQIATGNFGRNKVNKGAAEPIILPVQFSYAALNTTDTTWSDLYAACGHIWSGTVRPSLRLRLVLRSSIVGLVTRPETSTQINDVTCPFELPANSV